jgi:threonylcarbamoyladenosine tRNA methylthiotransferase MtaB
MQGILMKIFLDSIGCRLNQSEIESIGAQFLQAGHELVPSPKACDLAIINTCSVTAAAASDSRARTRASFRHNPSAKLILTGCWSTLEPQRAASLPGVMRVVPNKDKHSLVYDILGLPSASPSSPPAERPSLPGPRMRTRAFIKAQDGCQNRCAYCVATRARGDARSVPIEQVIADVQAAMAAGAQEAVLTGTQLSSYGCDLDGQVNLASLVRAVLAGTDIARLRLSSLEPWAVDKELLSLWSDARLCRQLHLPLQSGSSAVLRAMGRPISPSAYEALVNLARAMIPGISITTDIIVGFPGETESYFRESLAFIERLAFSRAHVFKFSPRPGTPAAALPDRISASSLRQRSSLVRESVACAECAFRQRFIGSTLAVLWETATPLGKQRWQLSGLTDNYLRASALADSNLHNKISQVRLLEIEGQALHGEILRS